MRVGLGLCDADLDGGPGRQVCYLIDSIIGMWFYVRMWSIFMKGSHGSVHPSGGLKLGIHAMARASLQVELEALCADMPTCISVGCRRCLPAASGLTWSYPPTAWRCCRATPCSTPWLDSCRPRSTEWCALCLKPLGASRNRDSIVP
jgi:hypothetical protein